MVRDFWFFSSVHFHMKHEMRKDRYVQSFNTGDNCLSLWTFKNAVATKSRHKTTKAYERFILIYHISVHTCIWCISWFSNFMKHKLWSLIRSNFSFFYYHNEILNKLWNLSDEKMNERYIGKRNKYKSKSFQLKNSFVIEGVD